jgi:hypothetical protein
MEAFLSRDLDSIGAEFESWRAQRKGRERIPEQLWAAAISLLDYYTVNKVSRALKLNSEQLQKRSKSNGNLVKQRRKSKGAFLQVQAGDLVKTLPLSNSIELPTTNEQTCRIVFERADGSRLSLSLPVELNLIQSICNGFIKA